MYIHVSKTRTFILNYTTKTAFFGNELYITQVLLFYKRYVYPFPVILLLNPKHAEFKCVHVCVCVWGGGGGGHFLLLLFLMFFFEFRAKRQIVFLANKQNLEEYFHRQHFKCEYFI